MLSFLLPIARCSSRGAFDLPDLKGVRMQQYSQTRLQMGLGVEVGMLARFEEDNDSIGTEFWEGEISAVNEVLSEHGLPQHSEPSRFEGTSPSSQDRRDCDSIGYSFVHCLRRVFAINTLYGDQYKITPYDEDDEDESSHEVEEVSNRLDSHLLCHSDNEGLYLPISFQKPIFDDRIPGGILGSSNQLVSELTTIAPVLGIQMEGSILPDTSVDFIENSLEEESEFWREHYAWLFFFESARLSVEFRSAMCFI